MRIGIDLGGTKIEAAVIDDRQNIVWRQRTPTLRHDYPATLKTIGHLLDQAEHATGHHFDAVGLAIPGAEHPENALIMNANSTWLIGQALARDLSELLQRPVYLANDANCFALSEAIDGAGQGYHTIFGVILGTGVGGAWVLDRQLWSGRNRIAGEWGHNLFCPDDETMAAKACYCGRKGCLETWLNGQALADLYNHLQHNSKRRIITSDAIDRLAAAGDVVAQQTLNRYAQRLAQALAGVINTVDPDCIVLGGGLSGLTMLYNAVPAVWTKWIFSPTVTTVLTPPKYGDASGVRGAAWLCPKVYSRG